VHSSGYVPGSRGTSAMSIVWCEPTSTSPATGADEPGGKLLAPKKAAALKLWLALLSLTSRSRTGTPALTRICSGSNAKLDSVTVIDTPTRLLIDRASQYQ
jgi:hypothetical protein